jgi:hypothetical protein
MKLTRTTTATIKSACLHAPKVLERPQIHRQPISMADIT